MLILDAFQNPGQFLALIAALVVGLTVHEFAHAWTAFRLGDLTAYLGGRMTLDPRRHIDPMGALVFLLVGFGWAKPVPVDGYRLGRRGMLGVAIAGPLSNVLLAAVAALAVRATLLAGAAAITQVTVFVINFLAFFMLLNLALAVFNMLPIAPLDGWNVLMGLVPEELAYRLEGVERYGFVILLGLILLGNFAGVGILSTLIWVPVQRLAALLLGPQSAAILGG